MLFILSYFLTLILPLLFRFFKLPFCATLFAILFSIQFLVSYAFASFSSWKIFALMGIFKDFQADSLTSSSIIKLVASRFRSYYKFGALLIDAYTLIDPNQFKNLYRYLKQRRNLKPRGGLSYANMVYFCVSLKIRGEMMPIFLYKIAKLKRLNKI